MRPWSRNKTIGALVALSATIALAAGGYDRLKDTVVIGQGAASTKKIQFDIGSGAANPAIQSTGAGVLQFANDGVNFTTFGTGSGGGAGVSVVKNDGFEIGTANWTNVSGTFTTTSTAANVGFDLASGAWTASATSQTLTTDQYTIPAGMYASVCSARIYYKGGSANLTLKVIDGSLATLASQVLTAQTAFVQTPDLRFICPASGTFALQVASTGSSAIVYLDKAFLGVAPRTVNETTTENLIPNGGAEDALNPTAWAVYDDGASASAVDGTGGSPAGVTATSITATSSAVISGSRSYLMAKTAVNAQGQGWSYNFTIPAHSPYQNALNDLYFDYYMDTAVADAVRVYLYDVTNSTLITPQFVTCGGGSTPSLASTTSTCHAELAWLASATGASYRLIFHVANTTATATNMWVDNLFIGQHRTTVGTQVGPSVSYTPTFTSLGTVTNINMNYSRSGSRIKVFGTFRAGTVTGSTVKFSLPGVTINSAFYTTSNNVLGYANVFSSASAAIFASGQGMVVITDPSDTGSLFMAATSGADNTHVTTAQTGTVLFANNTTVIVNTEFETNEWAGGSAFGENKVEYAYNTSTSDADDTTSFGTGPNGSTSPGALSTLRKKRVRFATPIQSTDQITLEIRGDATAPWVPASTGTSGGIGPFLYIGGVTAVQTYGIGLDSSTIVAGGTDLDVAFGHYGLNSNATYAGAGSAWSTSSCLWRVKKVKGGLATAFGLASATTPGLSSYEDSGTFTLNFTGARTVSATAVYHRVGKMVSFYIPTSAGVSCTASIFSSGASDMPASLRPLTSLNFVVQVQNNNAVVSSGTVYVPSTGAIQVTNTAQTAFTNAANCGWYASPIVYNIN